ncbi:asparaginase [Cyclobacterium amurskyense]|jgi:L-asparaginase|uniref:asparaginase n=1 Tax=Cyclobacterium amurskyense TaxID=320787 RepID=A0A0H4PE85_9BACT|nr:asparaginase [Cyclobacterium amurskyense]AKP52564.1 L-asparaginase, type I [Cyclobacterium amurskyense]|tara:strand:+ start:22283 stop:23359 length:1077 start_codon:yes stop_codon:yes gene_type:complete
MNYKIVRLNTAAKKEIEHSVLIIYTGGTLGMAYDENGALVPFNFGKILEKIPNLNNLNISITVISFPEPIDSSNINLNHWVDMAYIIYENYDTYDGFVVLHGTDTMAYSASMLSFMLKGLNKPVIFTGAQLPISAMRSDARENLMTSLEIAISKANGKPIVPEVCIFFNHMLLRGNRAKKVQSVHFDAFESENYPPLAESGIIIDYNYASIRPYEEGKKLRYLNKLDNSVMVLKLFPGITVQVIEHCLNMKGLKGVVLETYGSGNSPSESWFIKAMEAAVDRGILILNVSQCNGGRVIQGRYQTSMDLKRVGVLSGADITTEAAVTKMMFLLANESDETEIKRKLMMPLAGEMSVLNQ